MSKGKLFFTVAPARAGKSTFAKKWISEGNNDRVIVNSDLFRMAIHGERYNRHAEPVTFMFEQICIRAFLLGGYDVLFDETNTSEESIRKILRIDKDAQPIFINTSSEECVRRAYTSKQLDLVEKGVIERHFRNLHRLICKYHTDYQISEPGVVQAINKIKEEIYG